MWLIMLYSGSMTCILNQVSLLTDSLSFGTRGLLIDKRCGGSADRCIEARSRLGKAGAVSAFFAVC